MMYLYGIALPDNDFIQVECPQQIPSDHSIETIEEVKSLANGVKVRLFHNGVGANSAQQEAILRFFYQTRTPLRIYDGAAHSINAIGSYNLRVVFCAAIDDLYNQVDLDYFKKTVAF